MNNLARTDDQWREYVGEPMQKSLDSLIEAGKRMVEFKLDSDTMQGGGNFRARAKDVLDMSPTVASRWIKIGDNAQELMRMRTSLPTGKQDIIEILSIENWQEKAEAGEITPTTSRKDIRAIKKGAKAEEKEPVKKPKVEVSPNIEDIFNQIDGMSYADMGTVFDYILEHAIKAGKEGGKAGDDLVAHISRETAMALRTYYNNTIHIKL